MRFRWLDEDGRTVARARARSRACWQPDHRAERASCATLSSTAGGTYVVLVANTGRRPTGAFDVSVTRARADSSVTPSAAPARGRLLEAAGPRVPRRAPR